MKIYKPTSPGRRGMTGSTSPRSPRQGAGEGACSSRSRSTGGRNNHGRITRRFRGGGHKRRYRVIDFKRDKTGVPAKVASIEYDPNRTCRIALLHYADGEKAYILAPDKLKVGDDGDLGAARPTSSPATRCRCATSRSARRSTTSSSRSAAGGQLARSAGSRRS